MPTSNLTAISDVPELPTAHGDRVARLVSADSRREHSFFGTTTKGCGRENVWATRADLSPPTHTGAQSPYWGPGASCCAYKSRELLQGRGRTVEQADRTTTSG